MEDRKTTTTERGWMDSAAEYLKNNRVMFGMREPNEDDKRPVDVYDRQEIGRRVDAFMGKCGMLGMKPSVNAILDYLYETQKPYSDETFVPISYAIKGLQSGTLSPGVLVEVLLYAQEMEKKAVALLRKMTIVDKNIADEVEELKEVLKNVV